MNVKIPDDKNYCRIWGIDTTVDGNILLTDIDNCKIKLFSPDGVMLSALTPPEKPKDVAVINTSEATVSMWDKQIGIIGIADSGHLSLKKIIKTKQYVCGITAYNNNLIVTCGTSNERPHLVQMIDISGKAMWTTTTDSESKNLFDYATFLTTCSSDDGDTVIILDWAKQTITVLDAGTGKVFKVLDVKGKMPSCVTVDDNGNVYMCYQSGEITVWSRGMQEETHLKTGREYLKFPLAMAYNRNRSELVVTSDSDETGYRNFIHRYKISAI